MARAALVIAGAMLLASACAPAPTPTPTRAVTPAATQERTQTATTPTAPPTAPTVGPPAARPLAIVPEPPPRDLFDLAARYRGVSSAAPLPVERLYPDEKLGTIRRFWVLDPGPPEVFQVDVELRHVSEHALWYVDPLSEAANEAIADAADRFETEIFPRVVDEIGGGTRPLGPTTIITAPLRGGVAGYFNASDALPATVQPFSNERLTLFMLDAQGIGSEAYLGTLAHELQHLVHWLVDSTEVTWVNEGLSEFTALSLGLGALPFTPYLRRAGASITNWPEEIGQSLPNYAGASLFMQYLAHRTGQQDLSGLVAQQADGVAAVQRYLAEVAPELELGSLFADWAVANVVRAGEGRYGYPVPRRAVGVTRVVEGPASLSGQVQQFGAWYARIAPGPNGPLEVSFDGSLSTPLLPVDPANGSACWWSNRGDSIDTTLTRPLDLTDVSKATLRFLSWHALEDGWDYGYVAISTDGGRTWEALQGTNTTSEDPVGNALGPGYTGRSEGWRQERIDLTPFAGGRVLLRFEHVADDSISGAGWCVDDIEVPEAGYFDDAEGDDAEADGGWTANGFLRVTASGVEQRFEVRLVQGSGAEATVTPLDLDARNSGSVRILGPVVLVVTAMAPRTTEPARFGVTTTR